MCTRDIGAYRAIGGRRAYMAYPRYPAFVYRVSLLVFFFFFSPIYRLNCISINEEKAKRLTSKANLTAFSVSLPEVRYTPSWSLGISFPFASCIHVKGSGSVRCRPWRDFGRIGGLPDVDFRRQRIRGFGVRHYCVSRTDVSAGLSFLPAEGNSLPVGDADG